MTCQVRLAAPPLSRHWVAVACRLVLSFGLLWAGALWSAETFVVAGPGTLAAAIDAASPGDTLILQSGTYSGDATVNKPLSIRALNANTVAMVGGGTLYIDAVVGSVSIQGLRLSNSVNANGAADLKILENDFYKCDISANNVSHVAVIGNRIHEAGSIYVQGSGSDAYVAGNTLDNGRIYATIPAWIVGNSVNANEGSPIVAVYSPTQVIGNRISCLQYCSGGGINLYGMLTVLVAGNVVRVEGGSDPAIGIRASEVNYARVINNVINYATQMNGIGISANGQVEGNIVLNLPSNGTAIAGSGAQYNLCYGGTSGDCGSNALTVDPLFTDTIDFKLAAGSPAIDAGSDNPFLADLDRSRNDLGAYGGPWSIGQYDAQRDPSYAGPYVYPLFEAASGLLDATTLQVRALGVARFR